MARAGSREALQSGAAAEIFGRMVAAQGGPADFVERWPDRLPSAPVMIEVPALADGYVTAIDGEALGHAVVHLGGGRLREGDRVNPSVGLSDLAGIGEETGAGVPIAMVHAATEAAAEAAVRAVQAAYAIGPEMPEEPDADPEEDCLMARAFLIVMDSVGCGGAPDAAEFGDAGSNTLAHIAQACAEGRAEVGRSGPLRMPNLDALGLGAAIRLASGAATPGLGRGADGAVGGGDRGVARQGHARPGIGSWRGCRCPGTGPISPTRCPPFRTIWWPRSAGWRGRRASLGTATPRACRSSRSIAKSICGPAGRSATPARIPSSRSPRMKRPSGWSGC